MKDTQVAPAPPAVAAPSAGRLASIDILRGLAILWIICFHLWLDTVHTPYRTQLYVDVRRYALAGDVVGVVRYAGDALLAAGNFGVALFMMLSGISLALNAYRRGEPPFWRGYTTRLRRVIPVYWAGIGLFAATVALIALLQVSSDGGTFTRQWALVRAPGSGAPVKFGREEALWAVSIFGWIFRDNPESAGGVPVNSLWFVPLLIQYYLLFPFLLKVERRVGPWSFALAAVAVTLAARAAIVPSNRGTVQWLYDSRYVWALAPFRLSEFCLGISIGHLLATRRDAVGAWMQRGSDAAGVALLGLALCVTGLILAPRSDAEMIISDVVVHVGLALLIAPLLFRTPRRIEMSIVARALVFVGVVSFTGLITNDMMRYFASYLRYEDVTGPAWWFFLWVVYVPVGTLLAYPLAALFGLLPSQRAGARNAPAAAAEDEPRRLRRRQRGKLAREGRAKSAARA
ncbi:MAG TPA: acyltransferase [Dehalococcoidia bacterium]|nr:acyltransferase [Dehalococcoidia bacterium]